MISVESSQALPTVDVWAVWVGASTPVNRSYRALLSSEEISRADRFVFEHLRLSYEVSHGVLRLLLSQYLKCSPRELEFTAGHSGKPLLQGDSRLRFNMSHSGGLAVYAFTIDCDLGVDVEEVRDLSDVEQIADRYFCPAEASQLQSISDGKLRQDAFFRCWTRKESYIKAIGDGLSVPLDQFQVTLLPDATSHLVHIGQDTGAASAWTLQHLEPAPRYVGAIAYRAGARNIALRLAQPAQDILDFFAS